MSGPVILDPEDRPSMDDVYVPPDRLCPECQGYGFTIDSTANERTCPLCHGTGTR